MLTLIIGRSGSGKTHHILRRMEELATAGEEKLLLIVPEQASFETEKHLAARLGAGKAEVYSFSRLCDLIFRQYGGFCRTGADTGDKLLLMKNILLTQPEQMSLYARQRKNTRFVSQLVELTDELRNAGVHPEELATAAQNANNATLSRKLSELGAVYSAYQESLSSAFADETELILRALRRAAGKGFFSGFHIFLDDFFGFTYPQMRMLELILSEAEGVTLSVCCDRLQSAETADPFFTVRQMARRLKQTAEELGLPTREIHLEDPWRFETPALAEMETTLSADRPLPPFWGNWKGIRFFSASTPYQEITAIAARICNLVRSGKYRYRQIAVIGRDTAPYLPIFEEIFSKYEIPFFSDRKKDVRCHPLFLFVQTALRLGKAFSTDDFLLLCKTGLVTPDENLIARLENYTAIWSIKGAGWRKSWTAPEEGPGKSAEDALCPAELEQLRRTLTAPILTLREACRDQNGSQIARAVYGLLCDFHLPETLSRAAGEGTELFGEPMAETAQVYRTLLSSLDRMATALPDQPLSISEFSELFDSLSSGSQLSRIPPSLDEVQVGSAGHIRLAQIKACFVFGLAEGEFPRTTLSGGFFSERERDLLSTGILPRFKGPEELLCGEELVCYTALTAAGGEVNLSYSRTSLSGAVQTPSAPYQKLRGHFPLAPELDDATLPPYNLIYTPRSALSLLASGKGMSSDTRQEVESVVGEAGYHRELLRLRTPFRPESGIDDPTVTARLYPEHFSLSPSRLETFYLCEFRYFCKYTLRAQPRRKVQVGVLETGNLVHDCLHRLFAQKGADAFFSFSEEELHAAVTETLDLFITENYSGISRESARFFHLLRRLEAALLRLCRHLRREFAQSKFMPEDFELSIGRNGEIPPIVLKNPEGGTVFMEGKIDRVDVMRENGVSYVRVVDYKTGTRVFRLAEVMAGLNMQMLIYLFSLWENGTARYGNVIPAGVLYMPATADAILVNAGASEADRATEEGRKLKMNGIVLDDENVIRGMEEKAGGIFIPVKLKKDGTPDAHSRLISLEEMGKLRNEVEHLVAQMAALLRRGSTRINPTVAGGKDPCDSCDYRAVCGMEAGEEKQTV